MDSFDLNLWPEFQKMGARPMALSQRQIIDQVCIDSRRIYSPNALFFALKGRTDGHAYVGEALQKAAKYAVVDLNWQKPSWIAEEMLLRAESPLKALQSLAQSYRRQKNVPTVAICGSFGKTMVKDLLCQLLAAKGPLAASPESFNSQIGVPLALLQIKMGDRVALIEAGISHAEEMQRLADLIEPSAVIFTHLGKKHVATFGCLAKMAKEMMALPLCVSDAGWVLMPEHDLLKPYAQSLKAKVFGWQKPCANLPHVYVRGDGRLLDCRIEFPEGTVYQKKMSAEFAYFGDLLNMALKAAWQLGASSKDMLPVIEAYQPEVMKTEIWKSPMGAAFISDTYCSDPQSIDNALRLYDQAATSKRKVFVLAGLRGEGGYLAENYRRIAKGLLCAEIDMLMLVGAYPYGPLIEEFRHSKAHTSLVMCPNPGEMFAKLSQLVSSDDIVLVKGAQKEPLENFLQAFNDGPSNNIATINLAAIAANIALLRHKLPAGTRIMPAVKAFAYGTDEVFTAKFLASCGIDILCLSTPDEAIALRKAGARQALFAINAADYEAEKVVKWGLEVGISNLAQIQALAQAAKKAVATVKVHLHVDTGMNRFGCRPEEALMLAKAIHSCTELQLEGIMTHFAAAEDPQEDAFTFKQAQIFDRVIAELLQNGINPAWKHAANSAAAIRFHFPQYNMIRVGLALYGLHASRASSSSLELRQALSLHSRIVGINLCKKNETVSYGRSYKVKQDGERIAVIPLGYFDGLHRNYSDKGEVFILGAKAPMVGKICMDYLMVDISHIPEAKIGDAVLIFGEDHYGNYLCPQELALRGGSIVHQLITCLGPRIQRIFTFDEAKS